jgi:hypothetical protein
MLPPYRRWPELTNALIVTKELKAFGLDKKDIKKSFKK